MAKDTNESVGNTAHLRKPCEINRMKSELVLSTNHTHNTVEDAAPSTPASGSGWVALPCRAALLVAVLGTQQLWSTK